MPWVAAAGAVVGAVGQNMAANKAANASKNATNASIAEQQRQFDINQQNQRPFLQAGQNAVAQQQNLLGGDYSSFHLSPDYQFALQQGLQGLDRSAAARGSLYSGGHSADVMNYAQGLADQNYNSYYGKLAQMAGQGQGSAQSLGAAGQNMAGNVGNLLTNNAANQTQSAYDKANTWSNLLQQGVQGWGQYQGGQPPPATTNTSNFWTGGNSLTGGQYSGPGAMQAPNTASISWPGMNNSGTGSLS